MELHNVLDLLQHYPRRWVDRTKRVDIASLESVRKRRSSARCARSHGRRTRNGRALVEVVVSRRHVAAQRHVLQPGVAREAARGRHRSVVLRQARRVPRQAPDDEPGRRRARPGRRRRRQDRRDRSRLPAVGQGRGVHLAAARARRRGARQAAAPRGFADPLDEAMLDRHDLVDRDARDARDPPSRVDGRARRRATAG